MDVVVWLRSLGLGRYEAAFHDNDIDEAVLPSLTHENLKELGVASLGHRVKLALIVNDHWQSRFNSRNHRNAQRVGMVRAAFAPALLDHGAMRVPFRLELRCVCHLLSNRNLEIA
jgi:hypothetical protein